MYFQNINVIFYVDDLTWWFQLFNFYLLTFYSHIFHNTPTEEEIDEGAFKCLKYDMIKEIIPKVGKRAKFVQKYEEYKENLTERPAFGELQLDEKVTLANTFFFTSNTTG